MPLFLCDNCGVIENTALSSYWWKDQSAEVGGRALCSECTPATAGGEKFGKWHGKFPREFMTDEQIAEREDWSGWVDCERLSSTLAAYGDRMEAERDARMQAEKEAEAAKQEAHAKATTSPYPVSIQRMPCSSKAQRRAKSQAKARFAWQAAETAADG